MPKKKIHTYVFDTSKQIGRGAFGRVYKGRVDDQTDPYNRDKVAIKALDRKKIEAQDKYKELFLQEIKILRKIVSPYVVLLKDVIQTDNNYYIVQEFCAEGDLAALLQKRKKIPQKQALQFMSQILSGFFDIIRCGIVHRDFKPQNVLIHEGKLKIADFGLARPTGSGVEMQTQLGTFAYESPQLLYDQPYTNKCDIWAVGIVFYEIIYGKRPWNQVSPMKFKQAIRNKPVQFPAQVPIRKDLKDFIQKCLSPNQRTRMSWTEIFKCELFKNRVPNYEVLQHIIRYVVNKVSQTIEKCHKTQQQLFQEYNKDAINKKIMSRETFYKMIKAIAGNVKSYHMDFIISKFDLNADGKIDINQFKKIFQSQKKQFYLDPCQLRTFIFRLYQQEKLTAQNFQKQTLQFLTDRLQKSLKDIITETNTIFKIMNEVQAASKLFQKGVDKSTFDKIMVKLDPELVDIECDFWWGEFRPKDDKISAAKMMDKLQTFIQNT